MSEFIDGCWDSSPIPFCSFSGDNNCALLWQPQLTNVRLNLVSCPEDGDSPTNRPLTTNLDAKLADKDKVIRLQLTEIKKKEARISSLERQIAYLEAFPYSWPFPPEDWDAPEDFGIALN